jgi:hypothetical protein
MYISIPQSTTICMHFRSMLSNNRKHDGRTAEIHTVGCSAYIHAVGRTAVRHTVGRTAMIHTVGRTAVRHTVGRTAVRPYEFTISLFHYFTPSLI